MLMVMLMLVMRLVPASVARHSPDYNLWIISEGRRQVSWDTGRHVDVCTADGQRVTATECYHRSQLQGMSLYDTHFVVSAPCRLRGGKNRPTPFPGRMS